MLLVELNDSSTRLWSYKESLSLRPSLTLEKSFTTPEDKARGYLESFLVSSPKGFTYYAFPKGFFLC